MRATLVSGAFWAFLILTLVPMVSWWGPGIEERLFPVLANQTIVVHRDGNVITFTVELDKQRPCRLVQSGYQVVRGIERTPIIVRTIQEAPSVSYPTGHLKLGPFTAELPEMFLDADLIEGTLYYDCHSLWLTRQYPFGPVPIPPA